MTPVAVDDQLAILDLVNRYALYIDGGTAGRVPELFTEDGTWESVEVSMVGREAIGKGFGGRQERQRTSRHVCTGTVLEPDGNDVVGWTTFTLYRFDGDLAGKPAPLDGPMMIGTYHDRFTRTADGWRIAHRRATAEFVRRRSS
jgi:hypothetical protein